MSTAALAIAPLARAYLSAAYWTSEPRPVLIRMAVGFMRLTPGS